MRIVELNNYEDSLVISSLAKIDNVIYVFKDIGAGGIEKALMYIIFRLDDNLFIRPRFENDIDNELNRRRHLKGVKNKIIEIAESVDKFDQFLNELSNNGFYLIVLNDIAPFDAYDFYKENDQIRSWENVRFTKYVRKYFNPNKLSKLEVKREIEADIDDISAILNNTGENTESINVPILEIEYEDIEGRYRRKGASPRVKKPVVPVKILVSHPKSGKTFYRTYYVSKDKLKYYRERELKDREKGEQPKYITSVSEIDVAFSDPRLSVKVGDKLPFLQGKVRQDRIPQNATILSGSYFYLRDKFAEAVGSRREALSVIGRKEFHPKTDKNSLKSRVIFTDKKTNRTIGTVDTTVTFKQRKDDKNTVDFSYKSDISAYLSPDKLRQILGDDNIVSLPSYNKSVKIDGFIRTTKDKGGNPLSYMNISSISSKNGTVSMKELAYFVLANRNLVDMIFADIDRLPSGMVAKLLALGFTIPDNKRAFASYKQRITERVKKWREIVSEYRNKNKSTLNTELTDTDIRAIETALNKSSTLKEFQIELLRNRFDKFYLLFEELGIAKDYIGFINKRYEKDIAEGKRRPVNKLVFTTYNRTNRKATTTSEHILGSWMISVDPEHEYWLGAWANERLKYTV